MTDYIPTGWTMDDFAIEHHAYYESRAQVLTTPAQLRQMRQLVNAWEWHEGYGQGGENPHRAADVWVPLWRPLTSSDHAYQAASGKLVNRQPDIVFVAVKTQRSDRWFVVKCSHEQVSARTLNTLCREAGIRRAVPARFQTNAGGRGRFELPWLWLEPLEVFDTCLVADEQDDSVGRMANEWAQELRTAWALEGDGFGDGDLVLVEPERMLWLSAARSDDDGTAAVEEVLDRLAAVEDAAAEEAALGR